MSYGRQFREEVETYWQVCERWTDGSSRQTLEPPADGGCAQTAPPRKDSHGQEAGRMPRPDAHHAIRKQWFGFLRIIPPTEAHRPPGFSYSPGTRSKARKSNQGAPSPSLHRWKCTSFKPALPAHRRGQAQTWQTAFSTPKRQATKPGEGACLIHRRMRTAGRCNLPTSPSILP